MAMSSSMSVRLQTRYMTGKFVVDGKQMVQLHRSGRSCAKVAMRKDTSHAEVKHSMTLRTRGVRPAEKIRR